MGGTDRANHASESEEGTSVESSEVEESVEEEEFIPESVLELLFKDAPASEDILCLLRAAPQLRPNTALTLLLLRHIKILSLLMHKDLSLLPAAKEEYGLMLADLSSSPALAISGNTLRAISKSGNNREDKIYLHNRKGELLHNYRNKRTTNREVAEYCIIRGGEGVEEAERERRIRGCSAKHAREGQSKRGLLVTHIKPTLSLREYADKLLSYGNGSSAENGKTAAHGTLLNRGEEEEEENYAEEEDYAEREGEKGDEGGDDIVPRSGNTIYR